MLTNEQIKNIKSQKNIVFATCDKNRQPRCIWVQPSRISKNEIIISAIQMDKTFKNLKDNDNCFINVYIPEQDDLQYKIVGKAEIYDSGNLFNEIKHFEESENLPEELKVFAIIVVKILSVEESFG